MTIFGTIYVRQTAEYRIRVRLKEGDLDPADCLTEQAHQNIIELIKEGSISLSPYHISWEDEPIITDDGFVTQISYEG